MEVREKKVEDIKKEAEASIKCPVGRSLYYITEFLNGPMCGRCFPCEMGTYEARLRLERLQMGEGSEQDIRALKMIMKYMLVASMCKKGKDTARFVLEWIDTGVFEAHIQAECPQMECKGLIRYRIIPELCIICGACQDVCKFNAILGEKKKPFLSGYLPFEIRQKRCTRCGECIKVCPTGAIVLESKAVFERGLTLAQK
ncbi:MAG: 4Fe-4S binding protein [Thermodesulfovibrionales bacterium]|nr:4Fe-4S binding protein [Thermodesulfovibrionales bacterium]